MFGCIRGCSATQSQAEKGRDSIPPIEDEHQQFRPVFSCNPILSAVKQNLWYGVMHLQLPNTHLGFVPMRLLFFKHPYLANESKFPFWNGGPVLRWRGPFFFLPTNPLNNGIISLFSGDYLIVIVGRNWQLLPTTLASRSPRFVGYEVSYFKNTKLTSLRLLQQIEISKNQHSNYTSFWRRCKVEISMLNWQCIQESNPASWQIQRPQLLCPILLDMPHIFTA